jgi:hypothetical protein
MCKSQDFKGQVLRVVVATASNFSKSPGKTREQSVNVS